MSLRRKSSRIASVLVALTVAIVWVVVLLRLRVTTSIAHFLPEMPDRRAASLLKEVSESDLSRTLVLDVSGGSTEKLALVAHSMIAELARDPASASVRSGIGESSQHELVETFLRYPPTALLSPAAFTDRGIAEHLDRLKSRLGSPIGPFVARLAPRDPFSGLLDTLETTESLQGSALVSRGDLLFSQDETHVFVFATTNATAFDAPAQRAYVERVASSFEKVRGDDALRLETSGVAKFTIASEAQIRGDVERIGILSTVGVLLLFALAFRSLRLLLLGLVPLWFGSAVAIIASHFVFGEIHGITLAFGTSLLGVGIDYAEHYFSHFALEPEKGSEPIMRAVWPGLWMGALTTAIGLVGLGITGFPGLREIAFFSTAAIVGALVATRWLLPPWMPASYTRPRLLGAIASGIDRVLRGRRRTVAFALPMIGAALAVPGLFSLAIADDVSVLLALDPALVAEDTRVRERVSPFDPGRFAIVVDPDEERALASLGETTRALERARGDGILSTYVPLGAFLRSSLEQKEALAAARTRRELIAASMTERGFETAAFAPFFDAISSNDAILDLRAMLASPLGPLLRPLSPRLPEGQAFIVPLGGVRNVAELRERLDHAIVVDEASLLEGTYAHVRKQATRMAAIGLVLVFGTLLLRYRSARLAFGAFVPAVLAGAATIGFFGLVGVKVHLLHGMALLLVLSMGVDYGIFVVEGRRDSVESAHSLVSIAVATITTLLSFGLLAMSKNPALRAMGLTITIGLSLSALLCPLALLVVRSKPPEAAQ